MAWETVNTLRSNGLNGNELRIGKSGRISIGSEISESLGSHCTILLDTSLHCIGISKCGTTGRKLQTQLGGANAFLSATGLDIPLQCIRMVRTTVDSLPDWVGEYIVNPT